MASPLLLLPVQFVSRPRECKQPQSKTPCLISIKLVIPCYEMRCFISSNQYKTTGYAAQWSHLHLFLFLKTELRRRRWSFFRFVDCVLFVRSLRVRWSFSVRYVLLRVAKCLIMGWFSDNKENTINIKSDLDIHDLMLYALLFLLILILIGFYIAQKCKKLKTRHEALERRIRGV